MLGVGQGQMQQGMGVAQGLSGNAQAMGQQQLAGAGQYANNQNSMFNNYQGAYNTGAAQAQQEALRQQQAMQLISGLLGTSFGATLGAPNQVSPTGAQQGAQVGGMVGAGINQVLGAMGPGAGAGMAPPPYQVPGGFGIPYGLG
jgi:hypothetical protein